MSYERKIFPDNWLIYLFWDCSIRPDAIKVEIKVKTMVTILKNKNILFNLNHLFNFLATYFI